MTLALAEAGKNIRNAAGNKFSNMEKEEFISIYHKSIGCNFNLDEFQKNDVECSIRLFSLDEVGDFLNPWYIDNDGKKKDYNQNGNHISIKNCTKMLDIDNDEHKRHLSKIENLKRLIKNNKLLLYDPIFPIVGFDGNKYVILDGNHRIVAAYEIGITKYLVVYIKSSSFSKICPDF